jgi:hypothetical protein
VIGTLQPGNEAMTPHGLCTVVKAITWKRDGKDRVLGYWMMPRFGEMFQVHVDDVERVPSQADFAWAAAKVEAVIKNNFSIQ